MGKGINCLFDLVIDIKRFVVPNRNFVCWVWALAYGTIDRMAVEKGETEGRGSRVGPKVAVCAPINGFDRCWLNEEESA
jgi:hypothetical protein